MRTSIFIEQGDVQLVLTPDTAFERQVLASLLPEGEITACVMRGQFYQCRGGWWMKAEPGYTGESNDSFILRASTAHEPAAVPA